MNLEKLIQEILSGMDLKTLIAKSIEISVKECIHQMFTSDEGKKLVMSFLDQPYAMSSRYVSAEEIKPL